MVKASWLTKTAILAAIGAVLMYFDFSLPFFPVFLKLDFSDVPILIAGFALGPMAGITAELLKNIIHLPVSSTLAVGEAANFLIGCSLVLPAAWLYRRRRSFYMAITGMIIGVIIMSIIGVVLNWMVLLPLYAKLFAFPITDLVTAAHSLNSNINSERDLLVFCFLPFNLLKGFVVTAITALIYKKISILLSR